ncbi:MULTISPECIES: YicC/YloC family endoribonuclease [Acidobacteriaceae]|uniref:YicC/YloC family endoribonuclease n=1 Tax=Acidobacteriaceae TaxID=204434 RepID=UPI00131D96D9|nr:MULTISPECIES: YicC/YloC family endoribonuclease [Acidobacteriaceae]MDW5267144.1 YicC/YloC family endoribonuclease [Edaphobacter sp.]
MSAVYSMTGYANLRGSVREQLGFTLTIKSVNHRFLDLQFRLPSSCDALEIQLRRMLKEKLRRGHVDVTLQLERKANIQIQLNAGLLDAYVKAFREASALHGLSSEPDMNAILRLPGLMSAESSSASEEATQGLDEAVLSLLDELVGKLNEVRAQEGAALAAELRASMSRLLTSANEVAELRSGVRDALFERLRARLAELMQSTSVSEERLLAEAAVLAEKSDVDEEIVRLRTHVEHFVGILDAGGEVGKRLDFLLQELNREANTMLSKTSGASGGNSLRITELGLEMKAEIEKAREQVQNLE